MSFFEFRMTLLWHTASTDVSRALLIATVIQYYNDLLVESAYKQYDDYNSKDDSDVKVLPAWVIVVIVFVVLTAVCFGVGICCHVCVCGRKCDGRHGLVSLLTVSTGVDHNIQRTERNTNFRENPSNKGDKQVRKLHATLHQSEAPPKYEDAVHFESYKLDRTIDSTSGSTHDVKAPPPSYYLA